MKGIILSAEKRQKIEARLAMIKVIARHAEAKYVSEGCRKIADAAAEALAMLEPEASDLEDELCFMVDNAVNSYRPIARADSTKWKRMIHMLARRARGETL